MEQERSVSGTIRTLSNLLRRKAMEKVPQPPEGDIYSQMGGWVMAFLHQREGEEGRRSFSGMWSSASASAGPPPPAP